MITEAERSAAFRTLLLTRAREVARKQQRLYCGGVGRALTAKQLDGLRERILRFRDRIAASEADAIAPRATAPAETS
jgi:hypothetical protein